MLRTLLLLGAAWLFTTCGMSRQTTERKGRIIPLTDAILDAGGMDTVRFGHLRPGEIAVLHFWIENGATRAIAITSYDRTCGCTTFEFDSQPLAPGDAQQVSLTFDSRGERGWQLKLVDIFLAGACKPLRLYVEAEVE